jgi:hypothetical protein
MVRHRNRQRATHYATVTREEQVDDGAYGDPISGDATVLEDEPVQYSANGTGYVREESGERVERNPTIEGRGALAVLLQEGDDVALEPADPDGSTLSGLEIVSIVPDHGGRAHTGSTTIELEGV